MSLYRVTVIALTLTTRAISSLPALANLVSYCSTLDGSGNGTNRALMFDGSCYVLSDVGEPKQWRTVVQNMALCNHLPGVVDGHLPWAFTRAQMNGLAAVFAGGETPFNAYPQHGLYRFASTAGNGEGWYFLGHTFDNMYGPLPDLLSNKSLINAFADGNPNSWRGGTELIDNDVNDMMVNSFNANMEDGPASYSVLAATTCQYDSKPTDVRFMKETSCALLDITIMGVQSNSTATSQLDCILGCIDYGVMCTSVSFSTAIGCRFGLLIARSNVEEFCDTAATDGQVFVRKTSFEIW